MSINNQMSHTGVYAMILNQDKTHILLIKKARGLYTGLYDLPGGSPEYNESLVETLEREVLEETGLCVESSEQLVTLLGFFEKDQQELRHLGVIYSVRATGEPSTTPDGEDSAGSIWMNVHEISPEICTPCVCLLKEQGYML